MATSHLKYVLGLEKRTYELFRILRLKNREENGPLSQPMDSDSDSGGSDTEDPGDVWDAAHRFKGLTAGEGVPRTVHVAETYAERKAGAPRGGGDDEAHSCQGRAGE